MTDSTDTHHPPADDGRLTITLCTGGDTRTLVVEGDLDLTSHGRFCQALLDETGLPTRTPLRLDLTGVDFIDARTWLLIADVRRDLVSQGRAFSVMLESGRQPERVYQTLALDRIVPRF